MNRQLVVYVGHSGNVLNRILRGHCAGNVEGSALRKEVAKAMGYILWHGKHPSGRPKIRINRPDPRIGEAEVSNYIRGGKWRYAMCRSKEEARDFESYAIEQLKPLLNSDIRAWGQDRRLRYRALLNQLQEAKPLMWHKLRGQKSGPGVYVLYHQQPTVIEHA